MKAVDLTKILKKYKSGWVAIDSKNAKVIAHKKTFEEVADIPKNKKDFYIMPASNNYYGFITMISING